MADEYDRLKDPVNTKIACDLINVFMENDKDYVPPRLRNYSGLDIGFYFQSLFAEANRGREFIEPGSIGINDIEGPLNFCYLHTQGGGGEFDRQTLRQGGLGWANGWVITKFKQVARMPKEKRSEFVYSVSGKTPIIRVQSIFFQPDKLDWNITTPKYFVHKGEKEFVKGWPSSIWYPSWKPFSKSEDLYKRLLDPEDQGGSMKTPDDIAIRYSNHINSAISCVFESHYQWYAEIENPGGFSLKFPINRNAAVRIFKNRKIKEGNERRTMIHSWISEHLRMYKDRDGEMELTEVMRHFRGVLHFGWGGYKVHIHPSKYDLIQFEKLKNSKNGK